MARWWIPRSSRCGCATERSSSCDRSGPEDAPALQRLLRRLSDTSNDFRFFRRQRTFTDDQAHHLSDATGTSRFVLVAVAPVQPDEVIAVARYVRESDTNRAGFVIAVEESWQGRGLGHELMPG